MENEGMPDDKFKGASDIMEKIKGFLLARKGIAIRFLYTVMYWIILSILDMVIKLSSMVQFLILFATAKHNEQLRKFCNKVNTYAYKVMRYMTLTENARPYPFSDLPPEIEQVEEEVKF